MLEFIRQRAQGLVVGVIIGLICITFALWGVQEYFGGQGDPVVAEVEGEPVTASEFFRYYDQLERSASALGEDFDRRQFERAEFRNEQLEAFAKTELLEKVSRESGLRVSDEAVVQMLTETPLFQVDGKFSAEAYRRALDIFGYGSVEYEDRLRDAMAVTQLRFGLGGSAIASDSEARRLAAIEKETRDLGFTIVRREAFEAELEVSEEEIASFYEANKPRFVEPEKIDIAYLILSVEQLAGEVDVAEDDLRVFYEENTSEFVSAEERNANHILIQVPEDADEEAVAAARQKIVDLAARAAEGESFEDLAREYSDDLASRTEGGETGLFPRGVLDPEFEEAVFALEEGELSDPVRTKFGWHLIKVKEIEPERVKTFAEVRDEIRDRLRRERAEELFYELAERIDAPVFEHPETLTVAADELGLTMRETGPKTRLELADQFSGRVIEAIFSEEVYEAGLNSLPIDDGPGRVVVVRVREKTPPREKPLAEVRAEVVRILTRQRTAELAAETGQAMLERMRAGEPPADVAAGRGLEWTALEDAGRDSPEVNRAVLREAFRLRVADGEGARYAGLELGSGDYAVLAVSARRAPPPASIAESTASQLRQDLAGMRGQYVWEWAADAIEARHTVKTYPDRL